MTNLREMNQRREQWMNEKPSFDGGNKLQLRRDDLTLFQFAASGEDGDRFIKVYRSHIIAMVGKNGNRYNRTIFCPVQNGEPGECAMCNQGHTDIKERMSMWLYVFNNLHATIPTPRQGEAPPTWGQVTYEDRVYFNEEIMGWRLWEASAWKESPWSTINKLNELYHGLHNFTGQMVTVGDGIGRRHNVFAIPQSPGLTPELYQDAINNCEAIPIILAREVASPVVFNPIGQPAGAAQVATPIGAAVAAVQALQIPAQPVGPMRVPPPLGAGAVAPGAMTSVAPPLTMGQPTGNAFVPPTPLPPPPVLNLGVPSPVAAAPVLPERPTVEDRPGAQDAPFEGAVPQPEPETTPAPVSAPVAVAPVVPTTDPMAGGPANLTVGQPTPPIASPSPTATDGRRPMQGMF